MKSDASLSELYTHFIMHLYNPRKLVLVRDWKDTLTTVKSLSGLRAGAAHFVPCGASENGPNSENPNNYGIDCSSQDCVHIVKIVFLLEQATLGIVYTLWIVYTLCQLST